VSVRYEMPLVDRVKYPPVGKCIYCESKSKLTDEHIIPFGLGGNAVLQKASCRSCADITRDFETTVLRGELWAARVLKGIQSRTGHADAPKAYPLEIKKRGKRRKYFLYPIYHPAFLHFPRFALPGVFGSEGVTQGAPIWALDTVAMGLDPDKVAQRLNG
jgi:hypothetical protein